MCRLHSSRFEKKKKKKRGETSEDEFIDNQELMIKSRLNPDNILTFAKRASGSALGSEGMDVG